MGSSSKRLVVLTGLGVAGVATAVAVFASRNGDRDQTAVGPGSIVMLGDSITEQGDWNALLPEHDIVNAGHSGYTTAQLVPVAREVAIGEPATVFVLTGTNDIRDDHPPAWTVDRLNGLLDEIEQTSPSTAVVVQTITPRSDRSAEARATADAIRTVAEARGVRLLDLYAAFDDGFGGLRPAETTDGVHLSEAGYDRWARLLSTELESLQ